MRDSRSRRCEEVHLNLAYRWFCRLGLEDPVPDHSTFSKNRHGRFRESGTFRWLFERVVRQCMTAGLVFAHLKSILRLDRLRLRGLSGATNEFTLAAVAQNLRRLAKLSMPTWPGDGRGASGVAKMA